MLPCGKLSDQLTTSGVTRLTTREPEGLNTLLA